MVALAPQLLTMEEVAEHLRISRRTLQSLLKESGGVPDDLDASYFAPLLAGWAEQYQKGGRS